MRKRLYYIFLLLIALGAGCAQQGAPTGGPKDLDPPELLKAAPDNYSIQFTEKKIMLTFDEYLDMGNFTQELVVSPPMDEKPQIKLRNKTLIIEFEEELKEDITYTFNFGEGIKDLNERNVLLNFEYVFSTGDYLDSLSVKGRLKNAFDLSIPETPISVMLYKGLNDSLPLKEIPYYVGRADTDGNFAVNNLSPGNYKMFVLKDGNNNFLFDLPEEEIAFLDSTIKVDGAYFRKLFIESGKYDSSDLYQDTLILPVDTAGLSADTIAMILDSLEQAKPDFNSIYVDLFMFKEKPENQYIADYMRDKRYKLEMLFNLPLTDSFEYEPVFPAHLKREDFLEVFGKKRDSLTLWAADTTVAALDTMIFRLAYTVKDTLYRDVVTYDTLNFTYREQQAQGRNTRAKEEKASEEKEALKLETIRNNGRQNLHQKLTIRSETPISDIDVSKFNLFNIPDSVEIPVDVMPERVPGDIFRLQVEVDWPEENSYRMVLYPGMIRDVYGNTHDTVDIKFETRTISSYGKIILNLSKVEDVVLIQIIKREEVLRKQSIKKDGQYVFEYLDPAEYRVKFIHDKNQNEEWDTGDYLEGLQPERVEFLPSDINVRANWDHDVDYEMGSNDSLPQEEEEETEQATEKEEQVQPGSDFDTMPGTIAPSNRNQPNIRRTTEGPDPERIRR